MIHEILVLYQVSEKPPSKLMVTKPDLLLDIYSFLNQEELLTEIHCVALNSWNALYTCMFAYQLMNVGTNHNEMMN